MMAEQLEAPQAEKRDEVADVEAVGSGIESAIEHDGAGRETFGQLDGVGAVGEQAALLKLVEHIHAAGSKRARGVALKGILHLRVSGAAVFLCRFAWRTRVDATAAPLGRRRSYTWRRRSCNRTTLS